MQTAPEIVSRADAQASGLERYFTGEPCVRGHVSSRFVSSGKCKACQDAANDSHYERNADATKASAKRYRAANKDKVDAARRDWKARNLERVNAAKAEYNRANRERQNKQKRDWAHKNKDKVRAARAAYIEANGGLEAELERFRKWRAANDDKMREARRTYKKKNPHTVAAHQANRRARKLNATPVWSGELDELAVMEAANLCRIRAQATGMEWHVDHAVPLQAREACGLHCAANLQVIPAAMNTAKGNKLHLTEPLEWLRAI